MMNGQAIRGKSFEELVRPEWLTTNDLGGYACSTISGANTRKYHGLLVAAMTPPVRRMVLLSKMEETVVQDGWPAALSCNEYPGTVHPQGHQSLVSFENKPNPTWVYQGHGWTIKKELYLVKGENTVCVRYTLLDAKGPVQLQVRPLFALRGIHELMYQWNGVIEAKKGATARDWHIPATSRTPEVFFSHDGAFQGPGVWYFNTIYRCEESRGYSGLEDLWNPGVVTWTLQTGQAANVVCSSDPIDLKKFTVTRASSPCEMASTGKMPVSQTEVLDLLRRAAEQFLFDIPQDSGDRRVGVIAAYPWAPPSPRAALMAFTGLFLILGRFDQAKALISGLLKHLDKGLIPSEFPENGATPVYKGADVSLWLINAVGEYLRYTGDEKSLRLWLDKLIQIIADYRRGTSLGIAMESDGLVASHEPGVGTTWMDAKVGDWVITPRAGKPVELNALWYNALCLVSSWSNDEGLAKLAERVKLSFNVRFWNEQAGCCYDVVNGKNVDASIRPNQILAVSLPHAVLDIARHERVQETLSRQLLTPMGGRTLDTKDANYQPRYRGNAVERDRALHQGSAHAWLLGPMISAYLKIHGRGAQSRREAERMLQGCISYVQDHGQLPELFDGESPHAAGGAIASAVAVGEVLRAYVEDVMDVTPAPSVRANHVTASVRPIDAPVRSADSK